MQLWSHSEAAAAILADCAANPPKSDTTRSPFKRGVEMDRSGPVYDRTDSRVIKLCKLWDIATDLSLCPARGTPEYQTFRDAWSVQYEATVDAAITAAVAAAQMDIAA